MIFHFWTKYWSLNLQMYGSRAARFQSSQLKFKSSSAKSVNANERLKNCFPSCNWEIVRVRQVQKSDVFFSSLFVRRPLFLFIIELITEKIKDVLLFYFLQQWHIRTLIQLRRQYELSFQPLIFLKLLKILFSSGSLGVRSYLCQISRMQQVSYKVAFCWHSEVLCA